MPVLLRLTCFHIVAGGHQLLSMSPNSGSPMGGTQVTVTLSEEVDIGGLEPYVVRCQFGDKVVPAQSIFAAPESQGTMPELRVLCLVRRPMFFASVALCA